MTALRVPKLGWALLPAPSAESDGSKPAAGPVQVMRLDLSQQKVNELIRSIRNREKTHIIFGKNPTIHFGHKSEEVKPAPETFRNELYRTSNTDKGRVYFTGCFSHNLEVKRAEEDTADTDTSLAVLQASLAAYKKEKESKASVYDRNLSAPNNQKRSSKSKLTKPQHLNLLKGQTQLGNNNGTTRSMPASPSLGASFGQLSSANAPTSMPSSAANIRLLALRRPLVHLLAVRPVSDKFLSQQTCSSRENCLTILEKVGGRYRLDPSKWELSDRSYKELDVWAFDYPSPEDRQAAIDNAISAYDRLRLGREDKLWQMLLPLDERGKGKVLSKKDYSNGPLTGHNTPRINLQPAEDGITGGYTTGAESDFGQGRITPQIGEPMVRSSSQDMFKKKKVGEKEAMSKRLFSKNPQKATQAAVEKERKKIEKKETTEKKEKIEKKEKKPASKVESRFKSAEYVAESDDDDIEMKDAPILKSVEVKTHKVDDAPKKKATPVTNKSESRREERPNTSRPSKTSDHKKQASSSSSISSPPSTSDSGKSTKKAQNPTTQPPKEQSRPRTTSSPSKPSPLGSSPPTNASDFSGASKNFANSSSSSPMILDPKREAGPKKDPIKSDKPRGNDVHPAKSESLKRKADRLDSNLPFTNGTSAKRHQASPQSDTIDSSSGSSSPVSTHQQSLEKAQYFKKCWARYNKLHEDLSGMKSPSPEMKQKLWTMHRRLEQMKKEIWDVTGGK